MKNDIIHNEVVYSRIYPHHNLNTVLGLTLFFFEIMVTLGLAYTGGSPFIYAQF